MGRVREYNEGQSFDASFSFFDQDRVPSSPTTLRYRIDCLTTKQTIRDWTTVSASQQVEIPVTPNDNRIINSRNRSETRQMVVQTNHGTDTQSVETSDWIVKNVQGIT